MTVAKTPSPGGASRSVNVYPRARHGWLRLIVSLHRAGRIGRVLMPAYVGRSPIDGSGLWDPLTEAAVPVETYRTDRHALVDVQDLEQRLDRRRPALVLVIHYFGFVQPELRWISGRVSNSGGVLVEDCAHSLLSEVAYGSCGSSGEFAIYSFVKLLGRGPGAIADNTGSLERLRTTDLAAPAVVAEDWAGLSRLRRENYRALGELLEGDVSLLHPELPDDVVPQSLPILAPPAARHAIYDSLNEQGFGITALWHTLAHPAESAQDADARWLSERILNVPVHAPDSAQNMRMAAAVRRAVSRFN